MNRIKHAMISGLSVLLSYSLLFVCSAYGADLSTEQFVDDSFTARWGVEKYNFASLYGVDLSTEQFGDDSFAAGRGVEKYNFASLYGADLSTEQFGDDRFAAGLGVEKYNLPSFQSQSPLLLAQTDTGKGAAGADSSKLSAADEQRMIAEALANPLSHLWLLFAQNDTTWYNGDLLDRLGEDTKVQNSTLLMPVMPFQLTKNWKVISRVVIPINSFETVGNVGISTDSVPTVTGVDFKRETGLGDIVLWNAFSNQYKPPLVWGFGPTIMLDTASDPQLGTGKNSAGPMALVASITDKWIIGGVFQHWWSFSGDDTLTVNTSLGPVTVERPDVNLTDFQYIIRYRYSVETNIGVAPNIRYNWETDQLNLPIGIGFDTLIKIGKLPVKIGAEVHYFVEKDNEFGPDWLLRIYFTPVVPSPAWSKKPLF